MIKKTSSGPANRAASLARSRHRANREVLTAGRQRKNNRAPPTESSRGGARIETAAASFGLPLLASALAHSEHAARERCFYYYGHWYQAAPSFTLNFMNRSFTRLIVPATSGFTTALATSSQYAVVKLNGAMLPC